MNQTPETSVAGAPGKLTDLGDVFSPRISVVIPTHNRAEALDKCLASIYAQTYRPFEVIVVDDASTDNTAQQVADLKIIYIKNDKNLGTFHVHGCPGPGTGSSSQAVGTLPPRPQPE